MTRLPIASLVAIVLTSYSLFAEEKPIKVFILAGQSNMQGHAGVSTFDSLADDPKTAPLLKEMRDTDGKPKVCDKVWITSVGCQGDAYTDLKEQLGKLTVGYGAFGVEGNRVGPEFTFGLTMEKRLGDWTLAVSDYFTAAGGLAVTSNAAFASIALFCKMQHHVPS